MPHFEALGSGIGYRTELKYILPNIKNHLGFIEIYAESFMPSFGADKRKIDLLKELADSFKIVVHSVTLSLGSKKVDRNFLEEIKMICDIVNSPYYSDHLAITSVSNIELGQLSPIFYDDKMLRRITAHINLIQDYIERPFLIENIAYHFILNDTPYDEIQFINGLAHESGCGILLDLANIHANSINHHFDPYAYIDGIDQDYIVQLHIAGGEYDSKGYLYDSHNCMIEKETWGLLNYVLQKKPSANILLEHDDDFLEEEYIVSQLSLSQKLARINQKARVET